MSLVAPYLLSRELRNLYILHPEDFLKLFRWLSLSSWVLLHALSLDLQSSLGAGLEPFPEPELLGLVQTQDLGLGCPVFRSPPPELTSSQWDYSEWPDGT